MVAAQRSGSPNRSTSALAGLGVVAAPRGIDVDLRGQRDREDLAARRLGHAEGERSVGAAASGTHVDVVDPELGRDAARPRRSRPRRVMPRSARRAAGAKNASTAFCDGVAARDALPAGLDHADQLVAAVDRHDRVVRRVGEPVDDQRLDLGLEVGEDRVRPPPARSTPRGRARTRSRRPGSGRAPRRRRRPRCGRRTPARSGSGTCAHSSSSSVEVRPGSSDRVPVGRRPSSPARMAQHGSQAQRIRRSSDVQQVAVVLGHPRAAEVAARASAAAARRRGRRPRRAPCAAGARRPPRWASAGRAVRSRRERHLHLRARAAAAAAPARAGPARRPARARRAAGRSRARSRAQVRISPLSAASPRPAPQPAQALR